jgi:hypothetical protein
MITLYWRLSRKPGRKRKMPLIVGTYVSACRSAQTNINVYQDLHMFLNRPVNLHGFI